MTTNHRPRARTDTRGASQIIEADPRESFAPFRIFVRYLIEIRMVTAGVMFSLLAMSMSVAAESNFVDLRAECDQATGAVRAILETTEPFHGLLYSRNHPSTCRTDGAGGGITVLEMTPDRQCGIDFGDWYSRSVDVYVQHDSFVQQVNCIYYFFFKSF